MFRIICNFRVNNRKYSFGHEEGAYDWVCSKVPDGGRIKKDCVRKVTRSIHFSCYSEHILISHFPHVQRDAPHWYKHLLDNRDFRVGLHSTFILDWNTDNQPLSSHPIMFQGCNGAVCFCDDQDGCNHGDRNYFR